MNDSNNRNGLSLDFELGAIVRRTGLCTDKVMPIRNGSVLYPALDVANGGQWDVRLWERDIARKARIHEGRGMEAAFCTKDVLLLPEFVFQGLREEGEDEWLCYSGVPRWSYHRDGTAVKPRDNRVFLVFVDCDRVAYDWTWAERDNEDRQRPVMYQTRFRRQVYP